jgi:hypothetical protein
MRKSTLFLLYLSAQTALLLLVFAHASLKKRDDLTRLHDTTLMVRSLGLTDLCLFTEASYTRHPSLADVHTPFQDSPTALEHFPSGSLVIPPQLTEGD